jgi:hypothetical protein
VYEYSGGYVFLARTDVSFAGRLTMIKEKVKKSL